jgi:hypothetical protein
MNGNQIWPSTFPICLAKRLTMSYFLAETSFLLHHCFFGKALFKWRKYGDEMEDDHALSLCVVDNDAQPMCDI